MVHGHAENRQTRVEDAEDERQADAAGMIEAAGEEHEDDAAPDHVDQRMAGIGVRKPVRHPVARVPARVERP